ncbi:MAG TPA: hypothetical protein VM328_08850 [Fimbriimonadaceae bacterium]|nr:hypothetical protein [Fimbriimonadaceae bacterium]
MSAAMATFDEARAYFLCGVCETAQLATFQTRVTARPAMNVLDIGMPFEVTDDPETRGYLKLREHQAGTPIRILEAWNCGACGSAQWAWLVVEDHRLSDVERRDLTRETLADTHYGTIQLYYLLPVGSGGELDELPLNDKIDRLLQAAAQEAQ